MSNRGVISFLVSVLGILTIYVVLHFGFGIDPLSWHVVVAIMGGYFIGRVTYRIEHEGQGRS